MKNLSGSLVGVYEFKVLKIQVKFDGRDQEPLTLCSNFVTSYELGSSGLTEKVFSPIDIFVSDQSMQKEVILKSTSDTSFKFSDQSLIKFWLQNTGMFH